ncbi:hypothetical protein ACFQ14_00620 [Pseudahrensia aquimaris]|uniref:Uncharacterized protein n=1 Tax=Pseudahrensia aquimaris TaxID=744461 RepID=A0ABW3FAN7_9HYPH
MRYVLVLMGFLVLAATPALAASANEQSCALRAAILSKGATKPTDVVRTNFSWNTSLAPATISSALGYLDGPEYLDASVFLMSRVDGFYEMHLIAASVKDSAPLFISLHYGKVGEEMRLINVSFKDKLAELFPSVTTAGIVPQTSCE